jgi:hypothetical protein
MHYTEAPYCRCFRDLDLLAVQYAAVLGQSGPAYSTSCL